MLYAGHAKEGLEGQTATQLRPTRCLSAGSSETSALWLALAAPANIAGVSIMVNTPASAACESPITERGCASAVAAAGLSQGGCGYDFVGD